MITQITVENFKSIENLSVDLGRINVFIGANGVGKSNILEQDWGKCIRNWER